MNGLAITSARMPHAHRPPNRHRDRARLHLALRSAATMVMAVATTCVEAATCTWTGLLNGNWSSAINWSGLGCPLGPQTGDDLVFPDAPSNKALNDDISNLSIGSLTFDGSGGGYTLTGTGNLTISGASAITSKATGTNANTLNLTNAIKFSAATAVIDTTSNNDGKLFLNGPLDLNGST